MPKYKVYYQGYYYIEADNADEAIETDREDCEVKYNTWENYGADEQEG